MNIVGPPLSRVADRKAPERDVVSKGSDSFDRVLEAKSSSAKDLDRSAEKSPIADRKGERNIEARKDRDQKRSEALSDKKPDKADKPEKSEIKSDKKDQAERTEQAQTKEVGKSQGKKATSAREKAIQQFMDSFESEFSVPPTLIVAAMAQLSEQKLAKAPEETVNDVVSSLSLPQEEIPKAKEMYGNLVNQLAEIDKKSRFNPAQEGLVAAPMVQERFTSNIERQGVLRQGLDKLNDKFWMKGMSTSSNSLMVNDGGKGVGFTQQDSNVWSGTNDPTSMMAQQVGSGQIQDSIPDLDLGLPTGSALSQASADDADADVVLMPIKDAGMLVNQGLLSPNEVWGTDQAGMVEVPRQKMIMLKEELERGINSYDLRNASEANQNLVAGMKLNPQQVGFDQASAKLSPNSKTEDTLSQIMAQRLNAQANAQGLAKNGQKNSNSSGDKSDSNSSGKSDLLNSTLAGLGLQKLGSEQDFASLIQGDAKPVVMTPADHEANIKELMAQAQVLVKKGGGEMKLKMSPEGMGDVHLKISLNEGKVQVQLQAESTETKKALESGLAELKSSLAAQKLAVDNVKVDVVHHAQTDNQANPNMNMNGDAQRERLSQFWNQFRDNFGNGPKRESYMEMAGARSYTVRKGEALKPIDDAEEARVLRSDGRGRTLDFVA